jgi:hypothetical protein
MRLLQALTLHRGWVRTWLERCVALEVHSRLLSCVLAVRVYGEDEPLGLGLSHHLLCGQSRGVSHHTPHATQLTGCIWWRVGTETARLSWCVRARGTHLRPPSGRTGALYPAPPGCCSCEASACRAAPALTCVVIQKTRPVCQAAQGCKGSFLWYWQSPGQCRFHFNRHFFPAATAGSKRRQCRSDAAARLLPSCAGTHSGLSPVNALSRVRDDSAQLRQGREQSTAEAGRTSGRCPPGARGATA